MPGIPLLKRLLAALTLACFLVPLTSVEARVPVNTPVFSNPLDVTNEFMPVQPGAIKVYTGREDRLRTTIVESHLAAVRTVEWDGGTVDCRVVQELKFVSGQMVGLERMFVAQSDDGTVWGFGEVEDVDDETDEEDDDEDEPGGWIVGVRQPGDPADVLTVANPTVLMPARPEVRDLWFVENAPPFFVETATVQSTRSRVRVPAGRFLGCVRVRRIYEDGSHGGTEWFARGVGLVRNGAVRDHLRLQASTLR